MRIVAEMYGLVLADSGGVQEETTYLGVPCLTARPNTERPVTMTVGTNRLVESQARALVAEIAETLENRLLQQSRPELWDGIAAGRIVASLHQAA